jgi:hypothetical protein
MAHQSFCWLKDVPSSSFSISARVYRARWKKMLYSLAGRAFMGVIWRCFNKWSDTAAQLGHTKRNGHSLQRVATSSILPWVRMICKQLRGSVSTPTPILTRFSPETERFVQSAILRPLSLTIAYGLVSRFVKCAVVKCRDLCILQKLSQPRPGLVSFVVTDGDLGRTRCGLSGWL